MSIQPNPLDVNLSPSEASAFLDALLDTSDGGFRDRLTAGPESAKAALEQHNIFVSDALAATFQELPSIEIVSRIKSATGSDPGEPFSIPMVPLGACSGIALALIAGSTSTTE